MCNFCSKNKPEYWDDWKSVFKNDSIADKFDAVIKANTLIVNYDAYSCDSSFYEEIEINFCPICGFKLS